METRMQRRWRDPKYRAWYDSPAAVEARKEKSHREYIQRQDAMSQEEKAAYRKEMAARAREYRKREPDRHRNYEYKKHYGITFDEVKAMFVAQGEKCALCDQPITFPSKETHLDHDHEKNKIRGILHRHCNVLLGQCRENPAILELAKEYLSKHS